MTRYVKVQTDAVVIELSVNELRVLNHVLDVAVERPELFGVNVKVLQGGMSGAAAIFTSTVTRIMAKLRAANYAKLSRSVPSR